MQRLTFLCLLWILLVLPPLSAQDFSAIDEYARNLKAGNDISLLAEQLTSQYPSELEKVRSIFTYVATHVAYDCKLFHRKPEDRKARTYDDILERTLNKNMAVCAGYAILFDALAKEAGLNAEYVRGYARMGARSPNPDRLRSNHAWNAVEIDGQWYLLDATWSAGYTDPEVSKFTAAFDDYYFLTPPEKFFRRHWPLDARWQLLSEERSAQDFSDQPYFRKLPPGWRIHDYSPQEGVLSDRKRKHTFRIQLEGPDKVYFSMGKRRYEMEKDEDGYYTYDLRTSEVRSRRFTIVGAAEGRLRPVMEWRLGG